MLTTSILIFLCFDQGQSTYMKVRWIKAHYINQGGSGTILPQISNYSIYQALMELELRANQCKIN